MKIAIVHNRYQQAGGEDRVFEAESALLTSRGHAVTTYDVSNDAVRSMRRLTLARKTLWNQESYANFSESFLRDRPDIVHVHNTLPLVSPAVYYAARDAGAAVVQTLHNYRMVCPSGLLHRSGATCDLCVGRAVPWPSIQHKCYRGDRAASTVVTAMLAWHRAIGTYRNAVNRYIALTEFSKAQFVKGGMQESRISVKPNFVSEDPGVGNGRGGYALFVGRLTHEKGVDVLVRSWEHLRTVMPLRIIGDGPLAETIARDAAGNPAITVEGTRTQEYVREAMKEAVLVVVPSTWYETFGLVVIEAFAVGTPVVASRIGALEELLNDQNAGALVTPNDPDALADGILGLLRDGHRIRTMRHKAREKYEDAYTADRNYSRLLDIYTQAMANRRAASR